MNYYQHHIGDFIKDTARLTDSQSMAYLRLLWSYYDTEKPIDSDIDATAFKIGATASDVKQILQHYFTLESDGFWHNKRADVELAGIYKRSETARNNAKARWNHATALQPHSNGNADATKSDATQYPIPNTQYKEKNKEGRASPKGSRLQSDFELSNEWREWAEGERSDLDVQKTFDGFKDFWVAKAGKDGIKLDWLATWRNWIRNQKQALHFGVPVVAPRPTVVWKPEAYTPASADRVKAELAKVTHLLKVKTA